MATAIQAWAQRGIGTQETRSEGTQDHRTRQTPKKKIIGQDIIIVMSSVHKSINSQAGKTHHEKRTDKKKRIDMCVLAGLDHIQT